MLPHSSQRPGLWLLATGDVWPHRRHCCCSCEEEKPLPRQRGCCPECRLAGPQENRENPKTQILTAAGPLRPGGRSPHWESSRGDWQCVSSVFRFPPAGAYSARWTGLVSSPLPPLLKLLCNYCSSCLPKLQNHIL